MASLVQITLDPVGGDLWLRRLLCGQASPFRGACVPNNFLPKRIRSPAELWLLQGPPCDNL